MLYKIDGVIAEKRQLDAILAADYAYLTPTATVVTPGRTVVTRTGAVPVAEDSVTTTTTASVIPDAACPGGCRIRR